VRRGWELLPETTFLCHRSDEHGIEKHAGQLYFGVNAYDWPMGKRCFVIILWTGVGFSLGSSHSEGLRELRPTRRSAEAIVLLKRRMEIGLFLCGCCLKR
jgi:hypothetical protein